MTEREITPQEYHAHGFNHMRLPDLVAAGPLSASILSKARNPLAYITNPVSAPSKAMDWGNLVDCLLLTPQHFETNYAVLPHNAPQRPTAAMLAAKKPSPESIDRQNWWTDWDSRNRHKIAVDATEVAEAEKAVAMLRRYNEATEILANSRAQVALIGDNPLVDGGTAKALIDLLPMDGAYKRDVVDFKTTYDIEDRQLKRTGFTFDYLVKTAWYCLMAEAAGFGVRDRATLIFQRSEPPYDVKIRWYSMSEIQFAIHQIIPKRIANLRSINPANITNLLEQAPKPMEVEEWMMSAYANE